MASLLNYFEIVYHIQIDCEQIGELWYEKDHNDAYGLRVSFHTG
jgi:hypothetical protein